MVEIEVLKNAEDLQVLDDAQLASIQPLARVVSFEKGDKIFSEGDVADCLDYVLEGAVEMRFDPPSNANPDNDSFALLRRHGFGWKKSESTDENTITTVPAGMAFGWTCFVPPYYRCLSAYCNSGPCRVLQLERVGLMRLFDQEPRIGYLLMKSIATLVGERFHQLQREVIKRKGYEIMFRW